MANPEGICHLCGKYGPLSFEHVPPESAFNDRPVLLGAIEDVWDADLDDSKLWGKIQQRGAGAFTLCRRCNSLAALHRANERAQAVEVSIQRWYSTATPQVDPVKSPMI